MRGQGGLRPWACRIFFFLALFRDEKTGRVRKYWTMFRGGGGKEIFAPPRPKPKADVRLRFGVQGAEEKRARLLALKWVGIRAQGIF